MAESPERTRLPQLQHLGDATQFAQQMHSLVTYSPLFENFNLAEVRLLSHFMQAYNADEGQEIVREGEAGDFMMLVLEGQVEVFKQDRWNSPRLIASLGPGNTVGESR